MLVEERELQERLAVGDGRGDHRAVALQPARGGGAHRDEDTGLLPFHEIGDLGLTGPVEVTPRVIGQQVEDVADLERLEPLRLLLADPVEARDLDLAQFAKPDPVRRRAVTHDRSSVLGIRPRSTAPDPW